MGTSGLAPSEGNQLLLSDVLLALQKTFSRISGITAVRNSNEFKGQPLALIVGDVAFDLTLNVAPMLSPALSADLSTSKCDSLRYCANVGEGFPLRLQGRIATDIRHEEATQPPKPSSGPKLGDTHA
jgi:hypothetical protein